MKLFNKIFNTCFDIVNGKQGTVSINGRSFTGNSISIDSAGNVNVDGVTTKLDNFQHLNVIVEGGCETLNLTSGEVTVNGACGSVNTTSADINVAGDVAGNVKAVSGDVTIKGSVHGNVSTVSGDISV